MQALTPWLHAAPLQAIDRVVAMDDSGIVAEKTIGHDEPLLAGHFPGCPVYPGVFVLEAVSQSVLYYAAEQLGHSEPPELVKIRSIRLTHSLFPGDTLQVECRCQVDENRRLQVQAACKRMGVPTGEIKLSYRLGGDV